MAKIQTKYKDTVFRFLFSDPVHALCLYNAINGVVFYNGIIKQPEVDDCIRKNILKEFLLKQRLEVVKMSIYDFDMEQEMKLLRQDEREIGREEGREEGVLSIIRKLIQKGMDETQTINLLDCTEAEYAKAAMD